jgi:hypothetical protein
MNTDNLEYSEKQIDWFSHDATYSDALVSLIEGHILDVR